MRADSETNFRKITKKIQLQNLGGIPKIIGVLRGAKGALPPPPQKKKNWLRCSKLEVADQQGVVNSRS